MAKKNQLTKSDHLEYDEYNRLLDCLHKDKLFIWELYATLSFCTACRASDILNLRWEDIVGKHRLTVTEKKTRKPRMIILNPSVQAKLRQLRGLLGDPYMDGFIFFNANTGLPYTIQHVNRTLKSFKQKYNLRIENFSTHTFRKTFGRYVYDSHNHSAESLLLLNKILNHSSIDVTKAYIGITQDEINGIYNSIKL